MPVLPPSDAAYTRSGYSCANAPKQQSTPRKPVSPRAAHAAGSLPLVIVPGGAITLIGRNTPSLGAGWLSGGLVGLLASSHTLPLDASLQNPPPPARSGRKPPLDSWFFFF